MNRESEGDADQGGATQSGNVWWDGTFKIKEKSNKTRGFDQQEATNTKINYKRTRTNYKPKQETGSRRELKDKTKQKRTLTCEIKWPNHKTWIIRNINTGVKSAKLTQEVVKPAEN